MIVFLLIGMMLFFSAQNASYYMEKNVESVIENDNVVTKEPMAAIADADMRLIWNRTFGGSDADIGWSIWSNGTYFYTLGSTLSFGAVDFDFLLVKWDTDGNILWSRTWGGTNSDRGYSVWSDGTYLYTLGYTQSFGAGLHDFALVKWDTDGNVIWDRTWGGPDAEIGRSVWGNGTHLYTLGLGANIGTGARSFILVKWDTDGNTLWNRTWNGGLGESLWSDGSYLYTVGGSQTSGPGLEAFVLIKWDTNGNIIWNRTWGGSSVDWGNSIQGDGTYLYTLGYTNSSGAGLDDFALVKWDTDGNVIWNRTWGGSGIDWGGEVQINGLYLYTIGRTESFGAGDRDFALIQWDTDGNALWNRTWGGPNEDVGLSLWTNGTHLYTLGSSKSFGAGDFDFVFIKWGEDIINPVITTPNDIYYEQDTTGNSITWSVADANPDTYIIYRDSVEIESDTWTSGVLTINIDGLSIDSYNYTIIIYDESSNLAQDTVIVTVKEDITNPILNSPTDITYEEGTTGHSIAWNSTDTNPGTYIIYKDSVEIESDTWISGIPITINIDGLSIDSYNYTIIVYDEFSNSAQDIVIVTVEEDATNPVLSSPADIIYENGATGHNIAWNSTDTNPDTYVIYKNSIEIKSGAWISGVPITINVDGLNIGSHTYAIIVYDEFSYSTQDTVIVIVQDTTNPVLSSPADIAYEDGATGHNIDWSSTDNNPDTYIIYKDSIEIKSGAWISGVLTISVDGLSIGSYNYTIIVVDTSSNSVEDTVIVTVSEDAIITTLTSPDDIAYEEGTTGHNITWSVTDANPETCVIYKDDIEIYFSAWASGVPITINVDGLSVGSYNYTIIVYDEFDNFAQDTVIVTVQSQDTTDPIISSPADITYEEGATGHNIAWISTDTNPGTYVIYKDNVEIYSGVWASFGAPITISVDGLSPGEYNYTIVVYDEFDNSAQDTVIVTVTAAVTGGDAVNPLVISLAIIIPVASIGTIAAVVIKKRKAKNY